MSIPTRTAIIATAMAAAFAVTSTPSVAVDLPAVQPALAPVLDVQPPDPHSWTGLYAGLHVGYGWGISTWSVDAGNWWTIVGDVSADLHPAGLVGGGQIGVLQQNGNLVMGGEISGSWSNMNDSIQSPGFLEDTWISEIAALVLAQARLGFAMDGFVGFIQGGYAGAVAAGTIVVDFNGIQTYTEKQWENGWSVGGGFLVSRDWRRSFGVDYTFANFGPVIFDFDSSGAPDDNVDANLRVHVVKVSFNIHLGNGAM